MSPIEQWRTEVQPYLTDIRHHAKGMSYAVRQIAIRPAFLTQAQVEMEETERTLREALATVQQARAIYATKREEAA